MTVPQLTEKANETLKRQVQRIGIAGAGTMGKGIALAAAQAGYRVQLYDSQQEELHRAMQQIITKLDHLRSTGKLTDAEHAAIKQRLQPVTHADALMVDMLVEAIVEDLHEKIALFRLLAQHLPTAVPFCTNTSSLSVSAIARHVPHPERVVGLHFFNPADRIRLVEVVPTSATSPEVIACVCSVAETMGKVPVIARDVPGFIVNRIGKMYHTEPLHLLEQGIASVADIDALCEARGFPMGPFRLIDLIGVDVNLRITETLFDQLQAERFRPSPLQRHMVQQGLLGKKSGKGFYVYA